MKATILSLAVALETSSEKALINSILDTLPNGRILLSSEPAVALGEIESYKVRNFGAAVSPKVMEAYTLSKSGSRHKVERAGEEGTEAGNIATQAGLSTITFDSFGQFAVALLDALYSVSSFSAVASSITSDGTNIAANGVSSIEEYILDPGTVGNSVAVTDGSDESTFLADLVSNGFSNPRFEDGNLFFDDPGAGIEYQEDLTAMPIESYVGNGILLDQVDRTLAIVDVKHYSGAVNPETDAGSVIAEIERAVESGSFFE